MCMSEHDDKPVILCDSREQQGFTFDPAVVRVERCALPAGDYSLAGLADRVAVERKSLNDFVATVIRGRARFGIELKKLKSLEAACVVVEGDLSDVLAGRYKGGAHPHSVFGAVMSIIVDCGVPVYFCSDRQIACRFTQEYLLRFYRTRRNGGPTMLPDGPVDPAAPAIPADPVPPADPVHPTHTPEAADASW